MNVYFAVIRILASAAIYSTVEPVQYSWLRKEYGNTTDFLNSFLIEIWITLVFCKHHCGKRYSSFCSDFEGNKGIVATCGGTSEKDTFDRLSSALLSYHLYRPPDHSVSNLKDLDRWIVLDGVVTIYVIAVELMD